MVLRKSIRSVRPIYREYQLKGPEYSSASFTDSEKRKVSGLADGLDAFLRIVPALKKP